MNRRGKSKTSFASSTEYYYSDDKTSYGRSRAMLAAKLKREEKSKTSFDSSTGYYSYTDGTSLKRTPITFSPSPAFLQSPKTKLKLIALYEDQESLWNQCHKDFFDFERREQIWKAIAEEMKKDSPPEFWKHMIHRLRYNVELESIQEQEAKHSGTPVKTKLFYADKFLFLSHMFHREKGSPPKERVKWIIPRTGDALEKSPSRTQEKQKSRTPIMEKLATLEKLRNYQRNKLVLSPEAFQKMQKITSGGPYYLTNVKKKNKP
ncbi:uncharacterized protein LOC108089894 [Drosophila ficusphila]|uniref:uncharacterized protein LOC108089894 n=1 Tax=Drosophila ficusphila TaxID=30025 RepID=UPI001C8A2AE0|nr:uncharacterized protein LOC108089894 [Drosophila ficusphila]